MNHWTRARYQVNLPLYSNRGKVTSSEEHLSLARQAAREGMVLLKNEKNILPLKGGQRVALIGKGIFDFVKGGGGSGDVTCAYTINLYEGLKQQNNPPEIFEPLCEFYMNNIQEQYKAGALPGLTEEPTVPSNLIKKAADFTDTAIISISRFSGEGWDRQSVYYPKMEDSEKAFADLSHKLFPDSDFYLTENESEMVKDVCNHFSNVIAVLNIGGIMDAKWYAKNDSISSVLLAWQGGMTGGLAAADLIMGICSPCGKLPDSIAGDLTDYPSTAGFHESPDFVDYKEDIYVGYRYFETIPGAEKKVVYPFGYGLSYTSFSIDPQDLYAGEDFVEMTVNVTNIGACKGREIVQIYCKAPQGLLGKPEKTLTAFEKTRILLPGEKQDIHFRIPVYNIASFDDLGKISKSAYILEKGEYRFFAGSNVRDVKQFDSTFTFDENKIIKQLKPQLTPSQLKNRLLSDGSYEDLPQCEPNDFRENGLGWEGFPEGICYSPEVRSIPRLKYFGKDNGIAFDNVADGIEPLDDFITKISIEDQIHLLGGQPNTGVANTLGIGNLPQIGVPSVMTADGPAGLRIRPECGVYTTSFPCATLLASTWDPELVEKVGFAAGEEVKENNISVWLTPAVNIHRSPLCGRNFEYYSEDPLLAGVLSGAMIRGIQKNGVAAEIKHFCCNNKETNRRYSDSRVSERALREIYLKAFEIAINVGHPWALMTSYNLVNSQRCSESHDLLEKILREEWGFDGVVTTDWWNAGEQYKEINAGNDVKMGCGFPERVQMALERGLISEKTITRSARRVLEFILKLDF